MSIVAVVAMGEMGSGIAQRLTERGARVLTCLAGRSEASAARAARAGVEPVSEEELIGRADIFLSVVPPSAALETAERFIPLIAGAARKPVYIDCNAIAPETLQAVARGFVDKGLPFLDASIIGPPPKPGAPGARIYLSGPVTGEADFLSAHGLDTRVLSETPGDASALKMAYAGITKGFQALGVAMALGAARHGALDELVAELGDSQPHLYAWLAKQLPGMYAKAYRWDGEMREIAKFLAPEIGSAKMLGGAADIYQRVAQEYGGGEPSEIIPALDRFSKGPD